MRALVPALTALSLLLCADASAAPARQDRARAEQDRAQTEFARLAKSPGEPKIPGLNIVYLSPLGNPADAPWKNIIVHQTEGPTGSARSLALAQAKRPTKRGVTLWVETDGTVYWSVPETAIPTHGDGANRNDNKYVDNAATYRKVIKTNSLGVEFAGNHPDVAKPVTPEQMKAWLVLVRFLQARYDIPIERVYAHNWIDYKDARYCEGCELARVAHEQAKALPPPAPTAQTEPARVPGSDVPVSDQPPPPSACSLRLTEIATFAPLPPVNGPGECGATDVVRLETVRMQDGARVTLNPPPTLRCSMAEQVATWVRHDVGMLAKSLGSPLVAIQNYDSYDCRGRNRVVGAKISEHGKGNAIDIRLLRFRDGRQIDPTNPLAPKDFRTSLRASACARFMTVLGPGSDTYHENHIHLDMAERARGHRLCQWDVREPPVVVEVPLPQPRPAALSPEGKDSD